MRKSWSAENMNLFQAQAATLKCEQRQSFGRADAHRPSNAVTPQKHNSKSSTIFDQHLCLSRTMPICIECRYPVSSLYTTYSKADDRTLGKGVRLTQCPRCKRFADKYVEHDFVVLFLDLVLIKPQVGTFSLCCCVFLFLFIFIFVFRSAS